MRDTREFTPPKRRKKYPSRCPQCGGTVEPGITALIYVDGNGELSAVFGVPAGICQSCGEKYLRPETAEQIERLMAVPPTRKASVKAWDYPVSA